MNNRPGESTLATALRIIFAIIGVFVIIGFTVSTAMVTTVFNEHFWFDLFHREEMMDLLKDRIGISMEGVFREINPDIRIDNDEEITDEFITMAVDDYINLLMDDSYEIDEDNYRDFIDDHWDEFSDAFPAGTSKREVENSFADAFSETFDEAYEELEDSNAYDVMESFKGLISTFRISTVVNGVILAFMVIVLLLVHKNKFRPVRAMGISTTVAEVFCLAICGLMTTILNMALDEAGSDDRELARLFEGVINDYMGGITLAVAVALCLGIALIVIGAVGAGRYDSVNDTDNYSQQAGQFGDYDNFSNNNGIE